MLLEHTDGLKECETGGLYHGGWAFRRAAFDRVRGYGPHSNGEDQELAGRLNAGDFATSSLERWAYAHRSQTIKAQAITLDRLCADWPRLDLVKIDAEGAEALVWEGMQQTLRRFPHAAVVLELHLQRDPPQTVGFLHEIERAGYLLRSINYEGEVVPVGPDTILAQPQEHWTLWLRK